MTEATTPTGPSQETVSTPERKTTRRERLTAFNRRLASTCYSFGGIALLMFVFLLAADECEDDPPPDNTPPPAVDNTPPPDNTPPGPGCDPPEDSDNAGSSNPCDSNPGSSNPGDSNHGSSNPGDSNPGSSNPGDSNPGWQGHHFEENKKILENEGITAIPDDPSAVTNEQTVQTLLDDFGDHDGFQHEKADQALQDALEQHKIENPDYRPGHKIPRKVIAQMLCAGLSSCDDNASVEEQIVDLYGDPNADPDGENNRPGITAGYGNRPNNDPENLVEDFGGDNSATNGHVVAFFSRIEEIINENNGNGGNNGGGSNNGNGGGGNNNPQVYNPVVSQVGTTTPRVSLSPRSVSVNENAGTVSFTLRLSRASSETVAVNLTTTDGTANSSSDYAPVAIRVQFPPNVTSGRMSVTIHDDTANEQNESFSLRLSLPSNATLSSSSRATVTIRDNDDAPSFLGSVTNLTAVCVNGEIRLSWSPPTDGFTVNDYRFGVYDDAYLVSRVTGGTTTQTQAVVAIADTTQTYWAEVQARGGQNPNQAGWLPTGAITCTSTPQDSGSNDEWGL